MAFGCSEAPEVEERHGGVVTYDGQEKRVGGEIYMEQR
jgi:hypothetical protein